MGAAATRLGWEQDLPPWAEGDSLARGWAGCSTQHSAATPPLLPPPSSRSHQPHQPCYDAIKSQNTFALWRGACQESQVRHRLRLLKYREEPQPQ